MGAWELETEYETYQDRKVKQICLVSLSIINKESLISSSNMGSPPFLC